MFFSHRNQGVTVSNLFYVIFLGLLIFSWSPAISAETKSKPPVNSVAKYLESAELQAETDSQRREIQRALTDMLEKPAVKLRAQKYADYQGTPNMWTLPRLLTAYFVPKTPQVLEPRLFYKDVSKPAAKVAIRSKLKEIRRALQQQ